MEKWQNISQRERNYFLVLLVLLLFCSLYYFYQNTVVRNQMRITGDFYVYYAASTNYEKGLPFYNPGPYPLVQKNPLEDVSIRGVNYQYKFRPYLYLPFLAKMLVPLTHLPFRWVQIYWTWLLALSYLSGIIILLGYFVKRNEMNYWHASLFAFAGIYWLPAYTAFIAGQITPVVFLCLILHFLLWKEKRSYLSGFCLGVAILLKLSPAVFLVLWAAQKEWRNLGAAMLTVICGTVYSGLPMTWYYLTVIFPHISLGENDNVNLALLGFSHRYIFGLPWSWLTGEQVKTHCFYLLSIKVFLLMGWIITLWGIWRKLQPMQINRYFALSLCSLLLFSPVTRCYDFIYLYAALFLSSLEYIHSPSKYLLLSILSVAACSLFSMSNWFQFLAINPFLADLISKPFTLSALLLWGILLWQRCQRNAVIIESENSVKQNDTVVL